MGTCKIAVGGQSMAYFQSSDDKLACSLSDLAFSQDFFPSSKAVPGDNSPGHSVFFSLQGHSDKQWSHYLPFTILFLRA